MSSNSKSISVLSGLFAVPLGRRYDSRDKFMNKYLLAVLMLVSSSFVHASNSFSCKIKDISSSMSAQKYVIVHMNCDSGEPINTGTNGCTAATISKSSFTFDTSSEHGKINLSLALMAFASGKKIYASTYGTCPAEISSTPTLYSLKIFGSES